MLRLATASGFSRASATVAASCGQPGALGTALSNITGGAFTAAPWAIRIKTAWNNYNIEKNVLLRGGVGGIGETRETEGIIPPLWATPEDYRIGLTQDAQNAYQRASQISSRFHDLGGTGDPPGWDRNVAKDIKDLAQIEPGFNVEPNEIVSGKAWPDGKARKWLGYYDENGRSIAPRDRWEVQQ